MTFTSFSKSAYFLPRLGALGRGRPFSFRAIRHQPTCYLICPFRTGHIVGVLLHRGGPFSFRSMANQAMYCYICPFKTGHTAGISSVVASHSPSERYATSQRIAISVHSGRATLLGSVESWPTILLQNNIQLANVSLHLSMQGRPNC